MAATRYAIEGVATNDRGLVVYMRVETGGVPRFERVVVPWALMITAEVMRPLVERHTRSMEAPPPWNEGDATDTIC